MTEISGATERGCNWVTETVALLNPHKSEILMIGIFTLWTFDCRNKTRAIGGEQETIALISVFCNNFLTLLALRKSFV